MPPLRCAVLSHCPPAALFHCFSTAAYHLGEVAIGGVDVRPLEVVNLPLVVPELKGEAAVDWLLGVPGEVLPVRQVVRVVEVGAVFRCQLNRTTASVLGQLLRKGRKRG